MDEIKANKKATLLRSQGKISEALTIYEQLVANNAKYSATYANLGSLIIYKDPARALSLLHKALEIDPKNTDIAYNIATVLQVMGKTEESFKMAKQIVEKNPNYPHVYGSLFLRLRTFAKWDEADEIYKKMTALNDVTFEKQRITPETPYISVLTSQDKNKNYKIAKIWAEYDLDLSRGVELKKKKRIIKDKITIGYLSYDFHDHATLHLLMGVIKNHNRDEFNIYAYSYGVDSSSNYRDEFKKSIDKFVDIKDMGDLEAAQRISDDNVDILVDLKGHTSGCRLGILSYKPAPISITWLGFPGTTGASFIDYILADKIVVPQSDKKYYSEKVLYLPHSYQPNDNTQKISDKRLTRVNVGLPGNLDTIVFSCFNQPHKVTKDNFDCWMRILDAVKNSVLWIFIDNKEAEESYLTRAHQMGIDIKRIIFAYPLPKDEHLARLKLADLALDTFNYNGHTTTSDCLWAGVPVVSLKGNHFASRVSASLLTAIGLPELITNSLKEYEKLVIDLAKSPKKLAAIRKALFINRKSMPLFNTKQFTIDLEKIYAKIAK